MREIIDIHTHHAAPRLNAVVAVSPADFNPVEEQLYSVGIHPWDTGTEIAPETWTLLEETASRPEVAAIGECGLDTLRGGPLFRQMQIFKRHIDLSERLGKPLIIHDVRAHDIIVGMRRDLAPSQNWLIHGFRGKPTVAKMMLDAGMYLSIGEKFNPETIRVIPPDRLLAETDESEMTIEEIIGRISESAGRDVRGEVEENAGRLLGLEVGS